MTPAELKKIVAKGQRDIAENRRVGIRDPDSPIAAEFGKLRREASVAEMQLEAADKLRAGMTCVRNSSWPYYMFAPQPGCRCHCCVQAREYDVLRGPSPVRGFPHRSSKQAPGDGPSSKARRGHFESEKEVSAMFTCFLADLIFGVVVDDGVPF